MPASKANQRAVNKYVKNNYDRINVTFPKGQKEVIQAHATARGESVNGFIGRAIGEAMERDSAAPAATRSGAYVLPDGAIRLQDGALEAAGIWGGKCGETPVEYISNALLARLERDKEAEKREKEVV